MLAAVLIAALTLFSAKANAAAPDWEIRDLASERGISLTEAQERLEQQTLLPDLDERARAELKSASVACGSTWPTETA